MSFVLGLILLPFSLYAMLVALYMGALALGAMLFRKRTVDGSGAQRFALLVPAHNEEHQIGALLDDVDGLDYPRDCYALFVIADNCTDRTSEIVRERGGNVFERSDPENPGKGQALDWCLRSHGDTLGAYDAIALVDADMQIDAAFLGELSASLAVEDAQVVQALNTVAAPATNWRTALGFAGFSAINYVRPAGRSFWGGTAELKGSGMAFRAPLLLEYGWPAHSLAEDVEFSKRLLLDGVKVGFNPDALVTSAIPVHASQAAVQQRRWEGGRLDLARRSVGPWCAAFFRRPSIVYLDAIVDLLVPPQSVLMVLFGVLIPAAFFVHPLWAGVLLAGLGLVAAHILCGLWLGRAPLKVWLYLAAVPVYLVWKLPLYAKLLIAPKHDAWERTPRDAELEDAADDSPEA